MAWPTATDYFDAMQHPARRFAKPELKRGQPVLDALGKPVVHSGKCVDVYEMRGANGQDRWAIGCFLMEPRGLARRFHVIHEFLRQHPVAALVDTEYLDQGICIRGRWHPITRSRWVEGRTLNTHVREYLDHPEELRVLADQWVQSARALEVAGIAHGNLAADTVLVALEPGAPLQLRLVDYDGVFVPGLEEQLPEEMGHADFQHPGRSWQRAYNADVDRFSQLLVLTALHGLAAGGRSLWERFDKGDNLLFRHSDFQEPVHSALFRELWQSESKRVRVLAGHLILACKGGIADVPALETAVAAFRSEAGGRNGNPSNELVTQVNQLMEMDSGRQDFELAVDSDIPIDGVGDDFVLEVSDDLPTEQANAPETMETGLQGPPPLPAATALPLPAAAQQHPLTTTYEFEAWMPEQVAAVKLRGFVKDIGGQVTSSVAGYICVNLLDKEDMARAAAPGFLAWLGLVQQPPPLPRVEAVMELNLVHKPTATRQLIGITLRLTPGSDEVSAERWKSYCDAMFCQLRGYAMGGV